MSQSQRGAVGLTFFTEGVQECGGVPAAGAEEKKGAAGRTYLSRVHPSR